MFKNKQIQSLTGVKPSIDQLLAATADFDEWYVLGIQLGIKEISMENILMQYSKSDKRAKEKLFSLWLSIDKDASWRKIVKGLYLLGHKNLSYHIVNNFGPGW